MKKIILSCFAAAALATLTGCATPPATTSTTTTTVPAVPATSTTTTETHAN